MLFLGIFTFIKSKRAIRYDWAVAATLATVSFSSIMVTHSFDLPIDRLPWALDILPFSMLFCCIGYLLSRFLMPYMQKSKPKASLHAVYAAIGMAGLGLLRVFDELTRLSVTSMTQVPAIHFGCYVQHCLVLYHRSCFALLSTAGCCSSLAGRRLPSCACMNR